VISGPTQAQVGQPVTFSARNSSVAPGSHLTTFEWTFGDGTVATGVDVSHIYTNPGDYQVTLKVTDDKNRSDTVAQPLKIVPAPLTPTTPVEGPVALISAPSQGVVGQPVTFDASQSRPSDKITSYRWAFGDGSTADAVVVQKTYDAVGVYNVTMTVTDDQGVQDDDVVQINIVAAPPPDATATDTPVPTEEPTAAPTEEPTVAPTEEPTAAPTEEPTVAPTEEPTVAPTEEPTGPSANISGPSQAQVGESVTFDGSGSQAGSSAIVSYGWDFGDGGSDSGATVNHTYSLTGTFSVALTVTDENGLTDNTSSQIQITE
jgi:PKD repeat protein